jgi:hypothetical protein
VKQLLHRLFSIPSGESTPWSIIKWWESRRAIYNIVVGVFGLGNLFVFAYINDALLVPYVSFEERKWELWSPLVFAVVANLLYTVGWFVEVIIHGVIGRRMMKFAPVAFGLGLLLSVFLTFLPPVCDGIRWMRFVRTSHNAN